MGSNAGKPWGWLKVQSETFFYCWSRTQSMKIWSRTPLSKWFASSRLEELLLRRENVMKTKMVSYTLETLPQLTKAQIANLKALAALPDSEIDTSDIPELSAEQWKKGIRGRFYRPVKRQITARVDADVLAWLKAQGKGYQSRINAILRREMLAAVKAAK